MRLSVCTLLVALASLASAQTDTTPEITIPRVSRPPKLADFLNGTPREKETVVTDFRQMDPNDGAPASQPTTAYLSYDDRNLYVAFVVKDDPKLIRARVAKRKQILTDDRVTINIDTFHDHRHAYWFDVNPYAIQFDGITTDGYGDDFSWEGLWYSEAKIIEDGYVVLITVPFRTLRFPDTPVQQWGIILARFINRNNEFSIWPYVTRRKLPQFVAQFGHMNGLENISPGRNIQFIPYGRFSNAKYLDRLTGDAPRLAATREFRAGIDGKVVIKDALTLDLTLNPDFSQVESDEPQVTVNQRFEVFFPERRPFFIENASYFTTPETLFFSRRIADPEYGVRLTGRLGRWNIGAITADDRAPGKRVASSDPLFGSRAFDAVLSLQRDVFKDSHVRLFTTSRDLAASHNRVFSLDTRLRLMSNFFFSGQAITSRSKSIAGQEFSGNSYFAELRRTDRKVQFYSNYTDRSPGFRADLGFIPRVDIRQSKSRLGYKWWTEKSTLVNFGPAIIVLGNWNRAGQVQDWEASFEWNAEFKRLTYFTFSRTEAFELYQGQGFRKGINNYVFKSEWFRWLAAEAVYSHGGGVNYYPPAGLLPAAGASRQGRLGVTMRPTARLRLDETYVHSRLRMHPPGVQSPEETTVFNNHILRSKLNYQFNREFSLRAIVDYNSVLPNESLTAVNSTRRWSYDLLFTYLLNPGTAFYAGYTDIYENLSFQPLRWPYLTMTDSPNFNTGRQVFVKFSYLFRF